MMKVNFLPNNYRHYGYIGVVSFDGQDWFYGQWQTLERAELAMKNVPNGHVINSCRVIKGAC